MKTAIFGMTRLGKSNAMKTIATAVFQHSVHSGIRIGQLLFDPAGEYAHVNVQDQTALAQIGNEFVTVFQLGPPNLEEGIRSLSTNFFSDNTIEIVWSIVRSGLMPWIGSGYVESFLGADIIGPEDANIDRGAYSRARRRRAAFYATLLKADFIPPNNFSTSFQVNAGMLAIINRNRPDEETPEFTTNTHGYIRINADNLRVFWDSVVAASSDERNTKAEKTIIKQWIDSQLDAILTVYSGRTGRGYRLLESLRVFHSTATETDYVAEVLQELIDGKIVIIDLSLGSETILQYCSERIVNHILTDAARRFASGENPHRIQIFIEEAHRLFDREKFKAPSERDPYVRLAKEAAKFQIGLIYATQEVSSVDSMILANTSNWIITHLNNHSEVKELSKYYDFQDFSELTLKAEDVGFARIKTRSGRFITPIQIDLFSSERIEAARQAGLQWLERQNDREQDG